MTPLPPPLGSGEFVAWRLTRSVFAETWDSGEGTFRFGGRWSSVGRRVVYCAIDPATAILEVGVHLGFDALDRDPHVLTSLTVEEADAIRVVRPEEIDSTWMDPEMAGPAQQAFGDALLSEHPVVAIPSVVSRNSWNLLISLSTGRDSYQFRSQEPFVLDPRLHEDS